MAPYESVPMPQQQMMAPPFDPDMVRSPVEGPKPTPLSTGLHQDEMF
jgi:hypothetical protein